MQKETNYELECRLLEIEYRKQHKKGLSIFSDKSFESFPMDWFLNEDYSHKCAVLKEAIEKKCLIIETDLYQGMVEGVRYSK